nr:hypothetical protein [Rubripirellula sp.]
MKLFPAWHVRGYLIIITGGQRSCSLLARDVITLAASDAAVCFGLDPLLPMAIR